MSPIKSVAFAHGIWADGSCFAKVMAPLRAEGYEVIASQHGLDDFQADVDCTIRTFAQVPQDKFPQTNVFKSIKVEDGRVWMLPEGIEYFAGDLPEEEQQLVWATASPPAATLFGAKIESPAWRDKPCWNIVGTNDQSVHPDLERAAAKRMNGKITEVASSHVPMLSHPDVVLDVIRDACSSL